MAAVKASFFRMSATRNAFRKVRSTRPSSVVLEDLAGAARGLDLLARGLREAVGVDGQGLGQRAAAGQLDGHGAATEARLEGAEIDRLRARAELLERHRLLHVRTAQLAHPHVDRRLAALEADAALAARARAVALVAAAGRLAGAGALAAADAL